MFSPASIDISVYICLWTTSRRQFKSNDCYQTWPVVSYRWAHERRQLNFGRSRSKVIIIIMKFISDKMSIETIKKKEKNPRTCTHIHNSIFGDHSISGITDNMNPQGQCQGRWGRYVLYWAGLVHVLYLQYADVQLRNTQSLTVLCESYLFARHHWSEMSQRLSITSHQM